jgi:hypothetical protein
MAPFFISYRTPGSHLPPRKGVYHYWEYAYWRGWVALCLHPHGRDWWWHLQWQVQPNQESPWRNWVLQGLRGVTHDLELPIPICHLYISVYCLAYSPNYLRWLLTTYPFLSQSGLWILSNWVPEVEAIKCMCMCSCL